MFRKGFAKHSEIALKHSLSPSESITYIKQNNPLCVVFGGDIGSTNSLELVSMMIRQKLISPDVFYLITTWDADEARALKGLLPHSLYVPFCSKTANLVKRSLRP